MVAANNFVDRDPEGRPMYELGTTTSVFSTTAQYHYSFFSPILISLRCDRDNVVVVRSCRATVNSDLSAETHGIGEPEEIAALPPH